MSVDLVGWIRQQLILDVNDTIRAAAAIGREDGARDSWYRAFCWHCDWTTSGSEPNVEDAASEHVTTEHPDLRGFREVDAKRRILALYEETQEAAIAEVVPLLALPFADRPGYAEALATWSVYGTGGAIRPIDPSEAAS